MAAGAGFEASATGGRVWHQWLGLRLQLWVVVCGSSGWVSCVAAVAGFRVWQQWLGFVCGSSGWVSCVAAVAGFRVWQQWLGFVCGSSGQDKH